MQKSNVFIGGILSKQSFCFSKQQNQQSAHLPPGLVQENLHFCIRYFLKTKNKTTEKIMGQCFSVKSKVKCKNSAHLEVKKKTPKKTTYVVNAGAPSINSHFHCLKPVLNGHL